MNTRAIIWHLSRQPFHYNVTFARLFGITEAILLAYLINWSGENNDGWVYRTQEEIEADTALSPYQQRRARQKLASAGVVEEKRQGVPARNYYRVNTDKLIAIIENLGMPTTSQKPADHLTTRSEETSHLDVKQLNSKGSRNYTSIKEKRKEKKERNNQSSPTTRERVVKGKKHPSLFDDDMISSSSKSPDEISGNGNSGNGNSGKKNKAQASNEELSRAVKGYEEKTGRVLTLRDRDDFILLVDVYGAEKTLEAIQVAIERDARFPIPYAKSILENWFTAGKIKQRPVASQKDTRIIRGYGWVRVGTQGAGGTDARTEKMWLPINAIKTLKLEPLKPDGNALKKHPKYKPDDPNWMVSPQWRVVA